VSEVNSAACPLCKGAQWLYDYSEEEVIPRRCVCLEKQLLLSFLGPEIFGAKHIPSPLYQPTVSDKGEVDGDRTEDNLFIKGSWQIVCRHLHWVLAGKRRFSPKFHFKIVSDVQLLSVWLGSEAYKQRSREIRDDVETHNSLSDLISDPTLLIIRLGHLGYNNRAAAGVLKESLGIREVLFKPTWIIEGTDVFFGPGHKTYDDDVGTYVEGRFDIVDVGGDRQELVLDDTVAIGPGLEVPTPSEMDRPITSSRFDVRDPHVEERRKFKAYKPGRGKPSSGLPDI
jgi:hypothetical protein